MKNYLKNWTLMRTLRLIVGIVVLMQGVHDSQWMLIVLGIVFSIMPIFNISMCAMGSCEVPRHRETKRIT